MKLYTPLIYKALKIAYEAHDGQTDKSGIPYIYHPAFLAAQMDSEDEIITALLHDVVEDTSVSFADLEREGFPESVLTALKLLTHESGKNKKKNDYIKDYIWKIKNNALATKVKLADLKHNSNPTRNASLSPEEIKRLDDKYKHAIRILEDCINDWNEMIEKVNKNDPAAIFKLGRAHYYGNFCTQDTHLAFDLISQAMQLGLDREESVDDHPGYEHGELVATWYLAMMLLNDEDGILSKQTKPFWFEEKSFESASDVEQILMYITGGGCVERDLQKAKKIAFWIEDGLSFSHRHNSYAESLCYLFSEDKKYELPNKTPCD